MSLLHCSPPIIQYIEVQKSGANLGSLPEHINHYFDRQPGADFLHGLDTPPVCLQGGGETPGFHVNLSHATRTTIEMSSRGPRRACGTYDRYHFVGHAYLVVVAFGEEQGTELAVQRRLVGQVAVFG